MGLFRRLSKQNISLTPEKLGNEDEKKIASPLNSARAAKSKGDSGDGIMLRTQSESSHGSFQKFLSSPRKKDGSGMGMDKRISDAPPPVLSQTRRKPKPINNLSPDADDLPQKKSSSRKPPPLGGNVKNDQPTTPVKGGKFEGKGMVISRGGIQRAPKTERKISEALLEEQGKSLKIEKRVHITVKSLRDIKVLRTLGMGASGRVSLARHTKSGKLLAVKVVNVEDEATRNQLLHEVETLLKFISRFWVRFYDAFYDGSGAVYIALEYMDGGSLKDVLDRSGPMPEREMKQITTHIVHALKTLHETNWIHRDFKTANVLISREQNKAKLSDFGLARQLKAGETCKEQVGTLAFLSPERLNVLDYTFSADIWALGVMVVECLTGSHPFGGSHVYFDYLDKVTNLSNILPTDGSFSEDAINFVNACLSADPNDRPSAKELLAHPWLAQNKCDEKQFEEWLTKVCPASDPAPGK